MSTAFDQSAMLRRPPHSATVGAFGVTDRCAVKTCSTSGAAALTGVDVLGSDGKNAYVMFRFDQDCYVCLSKNASTAATALDWPIKANEVFEWLCLAPFDRYMTIIRVSADVTCRYYFTDRVDEP